MQTLSSPTLAVLTKLAIAGLTKNAIVTSLLAANLDRFIHDDSSKEKLIQSVLMKARRSAEDEDDKDAHRGLLIFAKELVSATVDTPDSEGSQSLFAQLKEALLADGHDLRWERPQVESEGLYGDIQMVEGPLVY